MMTKKEFGQRLLKLIRAKGWNQSELARRADNMARNNISTYCNGRSYPSPLALAKLAKALGISPDELLPGSGEELASQAHRSSTDVDHDLTIETVVGDPSQAWLHVNRQISTVLAAKIVGLLAGLDCR